MPIRVYIPLHPRGSAVYKFPIPPEQEFHSSQEATHYLKLHFSSLLEIGKFPKALYTEYVVMPDTSLVPENVLCKNSTQLTKITKWKCVSYSELVKVLQLELNKLKRSFRGPDAKHKSLKHADGLKRNLVLEARRWEQEIRTWLTRYMPEELQKSSFRSDKYGQDIDMAVVLSLVCSASEYRHRLQVTRHMPVKRGHVRHHTSMDVFLAQRGEFINLFDHHKKDFGHQEETKHM